MGVVQIIFSPSDYSLCDNMSGFTYLDLSRRWYFFPFSKKLFMSDMTYAWVQTFCTVTCNLDFVQAIRHFNYVKIEGRTFNSGVAIVGNHALRLVDTIGLDNSERRSY